MRLMNLLSRQKEASASDVMTTNLKRCLTTFDITLLGVGHMLGSGIYVISPSIANHTTGPALVVSYLIAGLASLLAALAYADFGVRYPRSGSAYSYAYFSIGEFWAFCVGWNLILENILSTAACARSCSAYVDSLLDNAIFNATKAFTGTLPGSYLSEAPDFLAAIILIGFVIFMTYGMNATSGLNDVLVCVNISILSVIIGVGVYFADFNNWTYHENNTHFVKEDHPEFINGFFPYGWNGVFQASAKCFFAYVGFDAIAASGEEALNPQKSLPIATLASMSIVTTLYVLVSAVLTLMVYFADINDTSGLPEALKLHHATWAQYIVSIGAVAGMSTVIMATIFAMARVGYAMADDGLLFKPFAKVTQRSRVPLVSMYVFTFIAILVSTFINTEAIIDMLSIGTLLAYMLVACALLVFKYSLPSEVPIELETRSSISASNGQNSLEDPFRLSTGYPVRGTPQPPRMLNPVTRETTTPKKSITHLLKPSFRLLERLLPADYEQRNLVVFAVTAICIGALCSALSVQFISTGTGAVGVLCALTTAIGLLVIVAGATLIFAHEMPTDASGHQYNMPFVPLLPIFSVVINVGLMATLDWVTWTRLILWLIIGFTIYFTYGIRHSRLNR